MIGSDHAGPADDSGPFTVLFLCTANVCRSPMAEHIFKRELVRRLGRAERWDWLVLSAGTHAVRGATMHPLTREVLSARGIPGEGATARQARPDLLASADLILTASRTHRAWTAERYPPAVSRVYPLLQFARLVAAGRARSGGTVLSGPGLLELAALGRSKVQPVAESADTIEDPVLGDRRDFERCAALISSCIGTILGPIQDP